MAIASGEIAPPTGVEPPKAAAIDGAFTECPVPTLQATAEALRASLASLAAIEAFVGEKVGASNGTNFAKLTDVLRTADKIMATRLARRGVATEPAADGGAADGADGSHDAARGGQGGGPSISGEINSREDVIRVLDKIVSYYQRVEPSSPIPLLIQRSKRLVSASFLDIVRDIAPDGLTQVENLRGKDGKDGM
jgi:type VI secretion system protein ImpA